MSIFGPCKLDEDLIDIGWCEYFPNIHKNKLKDEKELCKITNELTKNIERLKKENKELKIVLDSHVDKGD